MDGTGFDWTLLRSFLAVLDAGSLTAAARRAGVHQPTLSRHLAQLEAQLGAPLFERTGRGVVPTTLALAIADPARAMAEAADGVGRRLAARAMARTGSVRITSSRVAATWLLPPLLVALQRDEPGIAVEVVATDHLSNLLRREADIAVRMVRPAQASLVARRIGTIPIVAAAHATYLARAGTPRRPEDLARHRLIGYDRDDTIVRGFARLGQPLGREAFAVRTDDQVAYTQLVAAGAGIGFVADYLRRRLPGVQAVLPELAIPPLPCWLAVHREIRGNPVVRRVFDHLAAAIPEALAA